VVHVKVIDPVHKVFVVSVQLVTRVIDVKNVTIANEWNIFIS
jgi:hypothetical protein